MNNDGLLPRRTIEELAARYLLEPSLRDLYVEGTQDKAIYGWYLRSTGHQNVSVYEIGSVEVTRQILDSHQLAPGNRGRVIALAIELDRQFPTILLHVRCIADSDFDFITASRRSADHLLYTDYTSVELYTYDRGILGKVLSLGFNLTESDVQTLFDSISSVVRELFVIRAANQVLGWGMSLIPTTRCCTVVGTTISFDRAEFIDRCLKSENKMSERDEFEATCNALRCVDLNDDKEGIHSDDYVELLGWYLHRKRSWPGYRRGGRSILPILRPALDAALLSRETLFSQLDAIYA